MIEMGAQNNHRISHVERNPLLGSSPNDMLRRVKSSYGENISALFTQDTEGTELIISADRNMVANVTKGVFLFRPVPNVRSFLTRPWEEGKAVATLQGTVLTHDFSEHDANKEKGEDSDLLNRYHISAAAMDELQSEEEGIMISRVKIDPGSDAILSPKGQDHYAYKGAGNEECQYKRPALALSGEGRFAVEAMTPKQIGLPEEPRQTLSEVASRRTGKIEVKGTGAGPICGMNDGDSLADYCWRALRDAAQTEARYFEGSKLYKESHKSVNAFLDTFYPLIVSENVIIVAPKEGYTRYLVMTRTGVTGRGESQRNCWKIKQLYSQNNLARNLDDILSRA